MKKWHAVAMLLVGATLLGGTVLREPIANAAQSVSATIAGPLDAGGNVAVHEQGTAATRSANDEVVIYRSLSGKPNGLGDCGIVDEIYPVPADKTLVVEYIASRAAGEDAVAARGWVSGSGEEGLLPLTYEKAFSSDFSASDSVHYAFRAGTVLRFAALLSNASGCGFTISVGGYLQPSP
jgi:hypothetical protein